WTGWKDRGRRSRRPRRKRPGPGRSGQIPTPFPSSSQASPLHYTGKRGRRSRTNRRRAPPPFFLLFMKISQKETLSRPENSIPLAAGGVQDVLTRDRRLTGGKISA